MATDSFLTILMVQAITTPSLKFFQFIMDFIEIFKLRDFSMGFVL